jgi:hypothetical protein
MAPGYVFESKVEAAFAFDSKILVRAMNRSSCETVIEPPASDEATDLVVDNGKPRRRGEAFFFVYPISSGYQVQTKNQPNIFEGIRVEVVWNERQNFRTVREKLDNFSTFGVWEVWIAAELSTRGFLVTDLRSMSGFGDDGLVETLDR